MGCQLTSLIKKRDVSHEEPQLTSFGSKISLTQSPNWPILGRKHLWRGAPTEFPLVQKISLMQSPNWPPLVKTLTYCWPFRCFDLEILRDILLKKLWSWYFQTWRSPMDGIICNWLVQAGQEEENGIGCLIDLLLSCQLRFIFCISDIIIYFWINLCTT